MTRRLSLIWILAGATASGLVSSVQSQQGGSHDDYGDYGSSSGAGGGGGVDDYADYQDYADSYSQQDNLYHDYAARQQEKVDGGVGGAAGGGGNGGVGRLAVVSTIAWITGARYHSSRTARRMKAKFLKEQKQLYSQYYNDVYKLTEQTAELQFLVDQYQEALRQTEAKHELEALQRDYDEFKQPDIDGDDRISRAEFNMYVKNYLSNYPGLNEKDYPKFEDFDHDHDGHVSFQEYTQQMALQAQQAEMDALYGTGGTDSMNKADAMRQLAGEATKQNTFQDLYSQLK